MARKERDYQSGLIKRIESRFPGCIVLKNDEQYQPGIPDLTIFYGPYYAILEVKRSSREGFEPNQEYFLDLFAEMGSFSACIFPENEEEVLDEVQRAFGS